MSGKESRMKYLLDTNMLIYYLNNDERAIVTRNVDDFKNMDLDIVNIYE